MLQLAVVDTDGTATHFNTVDNHIVGIGTNSSRIGVKQRNVFRLRRGERMVHSIEALVFFAPLEEREIDHPQTCKFVLVAQTELVAHFQTQLTQLLAGLVGIVARQNQNQIARFGSKCFLHLLEHVLRIEFVHTGFHGSVGFHTGINHTFGADLRTFYVFGQLVELLAGIGSCSLGANTANVSRVVKYAEAIALEDVHQFDKLHSKTDIGLVATVIFHGIGPSHAWERFLDFQASNGLEKVFGHAFKEVEHVFLLYE